MLVPMRGAALDRWISHLRAIAGPQAVCGRAAGPAPRPAPPGDVGLWWALLDERIDVDAIIAAPTEGSLFPQGLYRALEVWTESDLCGLHVLWRLARERGRADWARRVERVRDWHLGHTQPDNATNRPWALHVFLLAGSPEAVLYAETLLHNSLAVEGRPDALSAWILIDSARQLEAVLAES